MYATTKKIKTALNYASLLYIRFYKIYLKKSIVLILGLKRDKNDFLMHKFQAPALIDQGDQSTISRVRQSATVELEQISDTS